MSANNVFALALPVSAFHTFRVPQKHPTSLPRGIRAQYRPERRNEVKSVRKRRACLRCSNLRIPCSTDDICVSCRKLVDAAQHSTERRTLWFCACIRTRVVEVNTFEHNIPPPDFVSPVPERAQLLALGSIALSFGSQVTWDLPTLVLEFTGWLNNPQKSTTSKEGMLSSLDFLDLVEPHVDAGMGVNFLRMLYAESLAYTQPTTDKKHQLSVSELQQIGAIAGHNILKYLDRKLRPGTLRSASREALQTVFLLLVGTILAVSYQYPSVNNIADYSFQFLAMQNHLCQILAHHLVYIGSRLNLPLTKDTERVIVESAAKRWHTKLYFRSVASRVEYEKLARLVGHCVDLDFDIDIGRQLESFFQNKDGQSCLLRGMKGYHQS